MKASTERVLTTHAGSLPRPPDLARMMYDLSEQKPVDEAALRKRVREAVVDVVRRQRDLGIDVVSDGEMGKLGFSNYVLQRFHGFTEHAQFVATDLADVPEVAVEAFGSEGAQHLRMPVLSGPIEPRDTDLVVEELDNLRAALAGGDPDDAFVPAVAPGQVAFNFPNRHYPSHRAYVEAAAAALAPEYRAIVEAGFNLQLDSPDSAMAAHCFTEGTDLADAREHLDTSIEVLNDALAGLPPEKLRYHVCWGNYRGPHHKDVGLRQIVGPVLRCRAKFIYLEAANPRHEHEWEVWKAVTLPDDKALIVGVIDTKTNHVEHPELVAQRIGRFAQIVGRERVIAATDCGFATFVGFHPCHPAVAWLKLGALVEGARLASERLWR
jgi:5-methyltetrahydropteroyltriglutamate--homocysteine methyltransferase